ncbi:MAG TPA: hypothetical protein VGP88_02625 [Thermoplasmata archaeon]|nr:hypothetical protein [Thermoplasmata archaeon]
MLASIAATHSPRRAASTATSPWTAADWNRSLHSGLGAWTPEPVHRITAHSAGAGAWRSTVRDEFSVTTMPPSAAAIASSKAPVALSPIDCETFADSRATASEGARTPSAFATARAIATDTAEELFSPFAGGIQEFTDRWT